MRRSRPCQRSCTSATRVRMRAVSEEPVCVSSNSVRCAASLARPCATTWPRSRSIARTCFISAVRSPTSWSRTRCKVWTSSCASDLSATNRVVGPVAASAMASASRSSFFCALTYGRTYSGNIRRTVCPCFTRARPMWCAPQHASIATTHPGNFAPKAITVSRRIRRRSTTRPAASSPTRLQLFLPRSIPSTAIVIVPRHPSSRPPCKPSSAAQ